MSDDKKIGKCSDPYCLQNMIRPISRDVCRNNCAEWKNNSCLRGYAVATVDWLK